MPYVGTVSQGCHHDCECAKEQGEHWSLMQTEKSQPECKQMMPDMRFTESLALSIDQRVGG